MRIRSACAVFGVVSVLIATAGCSSDGSDEATPTTPRAEADTSTETTAFEENPTFVEGTCDWDESDTPAEIPAEVTVTCGTVDVPADRTDADSALISLPVVRVHHRDGDAAESPILLLAGGPGGAGIGAVPTGVFGLESLTDRDVILWDQRGSGRSEPSLNCPEKEEAAVAALGAAAPFVDELQANLAAATECHDRLVAAGIDLDDYDTPASVADMESLRTALGVEQWNLSGGSYGTRLGLAYAREHPEQVRTLTIDSVYPTQTGGVDRARNAPGDAFDRLLDACDEDAACSAANPDLSASLQQAVASLDADPEVFTAAVEVGGRTVEKTFALTGADFRSGMFAAMYDGKLIPSIPGIITSVAAGDRSILPAYIDVGMPRIVGLSEGTLYSVDCADSGRSIADASSEELAGNGEESLYSFVASQLFCDVWGVEPVPESFNEPARPDVPTLVFASTLDPITPYADSKLQAESMPDARLVTVPRGGHGALSFDPCTISAFTTFVADPEADLPSCVGEIQPLPWSVGGAS